MNKQKLFVKMSLAATLALIVFGCSAEQRSVANHPPEIPTRVSKLETEVGRWAPTSISVFLWPPFRDESDMTDTFTQVNAASDAIDDLRAKIVGMKQQIGALRVQFAKMGCWAFTPQQPDPQNDAEWVKDWKPASTPEEAAQIQKCKDKQEERTPIQSEIYRMSTQDVAKQSGIIQQIVNRDGQQNFRSPSADDTKLSYLQLTPTGNGIKVKVMLVGFAGMGITQSTEEGESTQVNKTDNARIRDANYDTGIKSLTFKVPEFLKVRHVSSEGAETDVFVETGVYEFTLERSDFLVWARFEGNVKYTSITGEVRTGSVSLYGTLPKRSE